MTANSLFPHPFANLRSPQNDRFFKKKKEKQE